MIPLNSDVLGELKLKEVYEYYDKPVLFSCINENNQLFLAIWADETDDNDTWFYTELSQKRLDDMRKDLIDIKTALREAEYGFVYQVLVDKSDHSEVITKLSCEDIQDDNLPDSGEFL